MSFCLVLLAFTTTLKSAQANPYNNDLVDEEKRGWNNFNAGYGKRGWNNNFVTGYGKRAFDYEEIDDPYEFEESKRAWNSAFNGGLGKRAWNSGFNAGLGKRAWNSRFNGGVGKRAWNSFTGGYGKRAWNSFHGSGGFGKRSVDDQVEEEGGATFQK